MMPDWSPGDPVGKSAMYTIQACARAQNLPDDYLPYMSKFSDDPKFLFRAVAIIGVWAEIRVFSVTIVP